MSADKDHPTPQKPAKERQGGWTSERPTVAGWWWVRSGKGSPARIVELVDSREDREGLKVWCGGLHTSLRTWPGEWYGPLEVPGE